MPSSLENSEKSKTVLYRVSVNGRTTIIPKEDVPIYIDCYHTYKRFNKDFPGVLPEPEGFSITRIRPKRGRGFCKKKRQSG